MNHVFSYCQPHKARNTTDLMVDLMIDANLCLTCCSVSLVRLTYSGEVLTTLENRLPHPIAGRIALSLPVDENALTIDDGRPKTF